MSKVLHITNSYLRRMHKLLFTEMTWYQSNVRKSIWLKSVIHVALNNPSSNIYPNITGFWIKIKIKPKYGRPCMNFCSKRVNQFTSVALRQKIWQPLTLNSRILGYFEDYFKGLKLNRNTTFSGCFLKILLCYQNILTHVCQTVGRLELGMG